MSSRAVESKRKGRGSSRRSRKRRESQKQDENEESNFEFIRRFKKNGKQGIVGLSQMNDKEKTQCVFKISRYLNYTILHEYNIMKSLARVNPFCPHFCALRDIKSVKLSSDFRDQNNPFAVNSSQHKFETEVLFMEQVKGKSLYSLIKNDNIDDRIIFSALRQTIGAISIAQLEENFTHYDLHSSNILMKPCPKNSVALYLFEDKVVSTPTFGAMPIIIDFGFSYAKECNKNPSTVLLLTQI